MPWPTLAWLDALRDTLPYLSIALPFALVTIIGGIDNTESARRPPATSTARATFC